MPDLYWNLPIVDAVCFARIVRKEPQGTTPMLSLGGITFLQGPLGDG